MLAVQWARGMSYGMAKVADKAEEMRNKTKSLVSSGFPEFALANSFAALEILIREAIVGGFRAILDISPPRASGDVEDFAEYVGDSIFGRNGKLENLRALLGRLSTNPVFPSRVWSKLENARKMRNDVVHKGATPNHGDLLDAVDSVDTAFLQILSHIMSTVGISVEKLRNRLESDH